jgi:hypothetical protein
MVNSITDYGILADDLLASFKAKNGLIIENFLVNELTPEQLEILGKLGSLQLPNYMAEKVNQILASDPNNFVDFIDDLNEIYKISNTYNWKIINYIHNLKETIYTTYKIYSTFEIFSFFTALIMLIILEKKFKLSKRLSTLIISVIKDFIYSIPNLVRFYIYSFLCVSSYWYPVMSCCALYLPPLISENRWIDFYISNTPFVAKSIELCFKHSGIVNTVFSVVCWIVIAVRIPRPRIIRFHICRSFNLSIFQSLLANWYQSLEQGYHKNYEDLHTIEHFASLFLLINMWWLIPSLWQALTVSYPKKEFIRQAVEMNLGRDPFPGFEWWDNYKRKRKRKKK